MPFEKWSKRPLEIKAKQMDRAFTVKTIEGVMKGKPGDYLVKGIKGEEYPVDKQIFEESYSKLSPLAWFNARIKTHSISFEATKKKIAEIKQLPQDQRGQFFELHSSLIERSETQKAVISELLFLKKKIWGLVE